MNSVPKKSQNLVHKAGRFYFRMRVPKPLLVTYGKTEVSIALGDVSLSQANSLARKYTAQYDDKFQRELYQTGHVPNAPLQAGTGPADKLRIAIDEDVRVIARASARQRIADDEEVRLGGMDTVGGEWWADSMFATDQSLRRVLADGDVSEVIEQFRRELAAGGLAVPEDRGERRRLVRAWATEHAKGMEAIQLRIRGLPVETPPPVLLGQTKRMSHALEAWKGAGARSEKTAGTFARHAAMFATMMGDPPLASLTRSDGLRFRDLVQEWAVKEGKTRETANNVLASVRAMTNVARDKEWLDAAPFERMDVTQGGKESEGREPWTVEEVVVLLDSPLFRAYELPEGHSIATKGGRDAAYWVPLMAAYTGARAGELCQLWVDDLSEQDGSLVVEFRSSAKRGQRLKNKGSWRAVPVHSELMRLGFGDYWRAMKVAGHERLFPHVPREGQNGAGGQFGQWFGDYKRGKGFDTSQKTFHSFRHTVISELIFAGVEEAIRHAITGHEGTTVHEKTYAATIRRHAERLRPYVERISYPGLALPRVYPTAVAHGS
ncbi:tyrosine-type recombinase/integrase [Variovorax sp. RT4R15]|uniref:tyrosine-type recombinase/integrase n=1 Tax=Variovorax sp. RT4R15 TaxID=3443737 RepID=UPI003F453B81